MTDVVQRFWTKVDRSDTDGCWEWTAGRGRFGYGKFYYLGRTVHAHRALWEIAHAVSLPPHLFVCHHCDSPACVRLDHLFIGTAADNRRDAQVKGRLLSGDRHWTHVCPERMPRGDSHWIRRHPGATAGVRNGRAKVSPQDVHAIRERYAGGGITQEALGLIYGVNQQQVSHIVRRVQWSTA